MKRIIKKILFGYAIFLIIIITGVGCRHSYQEHEDFKISLLFPPWATYRGLESFTHKYEEITMRPDRSY